MTDDGSSAKIVLIAGREPLTASSMLTNHATIRVLEHTQSLLDEVTKLAPTLILMDREFLQEFGCSILVDLAAASPDASLTVRSTQPYPDDAQRDSAPSPRWTVTLAIDTTEGPLTTPTTHIPTARQPPRHQTSHPPAIHLTPREHEVIAAIADGCTYGEISRTLHMSEDTVKTHVRRIFTTLGARDRASAVAVAFRTGLLR